MTTHKEFYYILTFNTTTDAMCADKCAKENTNGHSCCTDAASSGI